MKIEDIIKLYESQTLEIKQSTSLIKEGCEALCGMINTDKGNGKLIFGVSPDFNIKGIDINNIDNIQKNIANHIKQKFDPEIICSIEIIDIEGKSIIFITADRIKTIPYYEYDGAAYIREGSIKRKLNISEKKQLEKKRNRDSHNGPWKCDKCGSFAGSISIVEFDGQNMKKSYKCSCGGEYYPE